MAERYVWHEEVGFEIHSTVISHISGNIFSALAELKTDYRQRLEIIYENV